MILSDFKVFPKSGRLIGIDWGARRTGIAVSDDFRDFVFARPAVIVKKNVELIDKIVDLIKLEHVVGVVIGLPLRTDGTESETTKMVRSFATDLSHVIELPIAFIDETLSSSSAQAEMGRTSMRDIKEKLDSESARIILENAIAVIRRN